MHRILCFAALATLTGCPLLELQTDSQEVCVTYHGAQVPAATAGHIAQVSQTFTLDVPDAVAQLASAHADLAFSRAVLHATSDVDLSFAQSASITVAPADGSLPPASAASCDDCAVTDNSLEIDATDPVDAAPYVAAAPLTVTVQLSGPPPTTAWTMDVDVCMTAAVDYTVDP
ncbi:MAG TPA: hypothetical protein VGM88_28755 [Kofleriaceae bacterium]|jgi:hypothetical protein